MSNKEVSDFVKRRLTAAQAATFVGLSYAELKRRRLEDYAIPSGQPRYYKMGRRFYYMPEDLDEFIANQAVNSIAEKYGEEQAA